MRFRISLNFLTRSNKRPLSSKSCSTDPAVQTEIDRISREADTALTQFEKTIIRYGKRLAGC